MYNSISKQGHFNNIARLKLQSSKEPLYIGIMEIARELHPGMGLRKMYEQFLPQGIGRDAFVSLGLREGFRLKTIDVYHRTTYSVKSNRYKNLLEGKRFTDVNQLWVSDLFYFPLEDRHYYVVLLMDIYSRKIVGYSIADNMRAENNVSALRMALNLRDIKNYNGTLIHHSDRGSQYVSNDYTDLLEEFGINISMCNVVYENTHSERVNGTIKNEYLKRWPINTYKDLQKRVHQAIENYNNRRHDIIKMTPNEYEVYLQSIPIEKRTEMKVYTERKNQNESTQYEINFNI